MCLAILTVTLFLLESATHIYHSKPNELSMLSLTVPLIASIWRIEPAQFNKQLW